ncbi:cinnamyl-alcohol dehydrogenase family [Arabidopsis lyrata subsp. lyrata]|uniref:Cinnamyl-alcohol dehydrogenase family n=1 Tax=Arabidopsis lyrata subsp. lyrata TaxID=81972 RepID=D7KJR1_ARALL|nr:cinnamoyl-CoA reductase 1 [Arabidopsis lyrata subsp. lyrata]EFH66014.1 cinnamyl-alcohol dehydrogenase family [Arabidopsis lyrata subsp. lyrata]|eukprot:XP_002889755.1 cinnamoyl-CoA reductase 1 [Arabidopsis lyrata subsp. lyrata]
MADRGKMVCVTGASGYVASWIVKLLLLRGYTVRATVRDPSDAKKTEHLLALEGAKERLKLFKADLLEESSFEQAIEGCDAVFHTASPVSLTVTDHQIELIDPAVKGTLNVLDTCAKVSSVKRVIVTSSMAAVLFRVPPLGPNDSVDESCFSDPNFCTENKLWYALSKTLAEDEAWRFAKEKGLDLVVINPGLVLGPLLKPSLTFSVNVIVDLITGKDNFINKNFRLVDVRDVALAHVKAFETPSANGRYIIEGPVVTINDIEKILREFFPDLNLVNKNEAIEIIPVIYKLCVEKVKSLGIEFTPTEATIRDTILSLKEKCLV